MSGPYSARFGAIHHEDQAGFLFSVSGPPKNAEDVARALNVSTRVTDLTEQVERLTKFLDYATQYAGGISLDTGTLPEQNMRYADLRDILTALATY